MISPKMAKFISHMPKGFVNFVCKKLLNHYIDKYADIHINGMENIDCDKPIIFICNHLSNSDGLVLNKVLKDYDPTFVAGIKLSGDPITSMGINMVKTIPIKPNTADKEAITKVVKTLKEGNNILIFPEGTRSREGSMIEAKKGIILIAKLTGANIVPIGMCGTENLLPISKDGNMSSEKFNYAEVYINIGKPIKLPKKDRDEDKHEYEERAVLYLMKNVAELLPEKYRGVYK